MNSIMSFKDYSNGKKLADSSVTTLSYDIEYNEDNSIYQEVKKYLVAKEWCFLIPELRVMTKTGKNRIVLKADTPNTTAWKAGITPKQACEEFRMALVTYDTNHADDTPKRFARGIAFATCNNVYDAVKVE